MKQQAFNPYLPSYEYIPDGEPYVFGGRVYVFGSHDKFNGTEFCMNDYVCWSAPIDDLGNWTNEGVIYRRSQDPLNKKGNQFLYAPDMQQGPDGRYYLYYALNRESVMSVAVSDKITGPYQFYGHVKYPDGRIFGKQKGDVNNFDPGVFVDDDGEIYLYTGFAPVGMIKTMMKLRGCKLDGAYCVQLEPDMLTIKKDPVIVAPGADISKGTGFEGHEFFEASSMRKIGKRYYFIYSSILSHELCYAVSDRPDGGFQYGGTIVSNGDVGIYSCEHAVNYLGNTHGSIVEIAGEWYVFYHRVTNAHHYSRQGCAERIRIKKDGRILQAEITSCGLNGDPLSGTGTYEARIACNLSSKIGTYQCGLKLANKKALESHPYFTQSGGDREANGDQYIANMRDGAWAGYKYFKFNGEKEISIRARGTAKGAFQVYTKRGGKPIARFEIQPTTDWDTYISDFNIPAGEHALYFEFSGTGALDFSSFTMK
ncbi:MAG TPA: family 43 glycosylhydrolase [Clostridiales bacterium]|nr:family 43 glycosylhydrolase [Clostridiales bacterium]